MSELFPVIGRNSSVGVPQDPCSGPFLDKHAKTGDLTVRATRKVNPQVFRFLQVRKWPIGENGGWDSSNSNSCPCGTFPIEKFDMSHLNQLLFECHQIYRFFESACDKTNWKSASTFLHSGSRVLSMFFCCRSPLWNSQPASLTHVHVVCPEIQNQGNDIKQTLSSIRSTKGNYHCSGQFELNAPGRLDVCRSRLRNHLCKK